MDLHGNAALSWSGRRELARRVVDRGWTLTAAAEAAGVSVRCARKWVGRYRAGDRHLLELEGLLADQLDTRVKINMGPKRGRVVIEFADLEDLERIYRVMSPGEYPAPA